MHSVGLRALKLAACGLFSVLLCLAQNWSTADSLPGVDFSGLTAAQKATALKILRQHDCSCACGMKIAECRVKDPSCSYSNGLTAAVIQALKSGKSEADAVAAAENSKWAHAQPTKVLDDPVKIPVAGAPQLGPANASITIVEFSDFQCPYCAAAVPEIKALMNTYPKQVKLIFKQFPLDIHSQAELAANAAVAAGLQGKFWQMHDAMFAHHDELSRATIDALAKQIGLDTNRFASDMNSTQVHETVVRDQQDGDQAGVQGTPTIFIDGQKYNGPITLNYLKLVMDAELKHQSTFKQTASLKH
jgi:protein-disulfide isomerase